MDHETTLLLLRCIPLLFVFCFGACVGSLANVLIFRLPAGQGVVREPSACPSCGTRLTWRENIPILGWLLLRGRCRFCKAPISAQYPIIEAAVAIMFVLVWVQLYWVNSGWSIGGISLARMVPDFASAGWELTWPLYAIVVLLFAMLLAATVIDARTFTIPLELPWAATLIGVVVHTVWAVVVQLKWGGLMLADRSVHWSMSIPVNWAFPADTLGVPPHVETSGMWWWVGLAIGGAVGLGVSCWLLSKGIIRRSGDGYEAWEMEELGRQRALAERAKSEAGVAHIALDEHGMPKDPSELWVLYPHARREMIKEAAFLAAPVLMGLGSGALLFWLHMPQISAGAGAAIEQGGAVVGQIVFPKTLPPLWLLVFCGSILGYLLVGGLLWGVRIGGTLLFGKEAMGMGDIHLMAAVGACLGWIDGTLAFFLSAPVALVGWLVGYLVARLRGSDKGTTLPFGPWLSVATVLVFVGKPLIEWGLSALTNAQPPINLP